jgi:hypothetical protein
MLYLGNYCDLSLLNSSLINVIGFQYTAKQPSLMSVAGSVLPVLAGWREEQLEQRLR